MQHRHDCHVLGALQYGTLTISVIQAAVLSVADHAAMIGGRATFGVNGVPSQAVSAPFSCGVCKSDSMLCAHTCPPEHCPVLYWAVSECCLRCLGVTLQLLLHSCGSTVTPDYMSVGICLV